MKLRTIFLMLVFWSITSPAVVAGAESSLAKKTRQSIETLSGLKAHEIIIEEHYASIKLSGFVSSALDQEQVVRTVRAVEGVKSVLNYLEVRDPRTAPAFLPGKPGGLAGKVQAELVKKLSFSGPYRVDIRVAAGLVTLSGQVASRAEADEAEEITLNVPGVESVINDIKVVPNSNGGLRGAREQP
jgi:hyperosmotically inducible periplasmic protein